MGAARRVLPVAAAALLLAGCSSGPPPPSHAAPTGPSFEAHFDRFAPGPLGGFDVPLGTWSIVADEAAPSPPNAVEASRVPAMALAPVGTYFNADLSTRFLAGSGPQRAGLVLGWAPNASFDLARIDVAVGRVELLRLELAGGERALAGANATIASGVWHELRLDARGASVRVFVDDQLAFDARDEARATGEAGLWADGVATRFDDFIVAPG